MVDEVELARLRAENEQLRAENDQLRQMDRGRRHYAPPPCLESKILQWVASRTDPEGILSEKYFAQRPVSDEELRRVCDDVLNKSGFAGDKTYYIYGDKWVILWRYYVICRISNITMPDWLLRYFDAVAICLFSLEEQGGARWKRFTAEANKVFGKHGTDSSEKQTKAYNAVLAALPEVAKNHLAATAILERVARELGVHISSLRRTIDEHFKDDWLSARNSSRELVENKKRNLSKS